MGDDWQKHGPYILVLVLSWAVAALAVNPLGSFPLNDDWAYSKDVWNLVENGVLLLDDFPAMTRLVHIFWGAAWCKIFGFSFQVLRFSTLAMGCGGLLVAYFLFLEMGAAKRLALAGSWVLGFSPLYFSLSYTFMTDVPFIALFLLSVLFFVKSLKSCRLRHIIWAAVAALLATMTRQMGLLAPLAFLLAWLYRGRWDWKSVFWAVMPLALSLAAYLLFTRWLAANQGLPETYGSIEKLLERPGRAGFFGETLQRTGILLFSFGLFLLPVSALLFSGHFNKAGRGTKWWALGLTALLAVTLVFAWRWVPWGNLFYNLGLGPKTLKDASVGLNVAPKLGASGMALLKSTGSLGALILLLCLVPAAFRSFRKGAATQLTGVFLWAMIVVYGVFLLLETYFFDRYYLTLLPLLITVLVQNQAWGFRKIPMAVAGISFLLLSVFSTAATHDYLAWNRARWQALDYLTIEKGITPAQIDGGFEFNGWHKPGPRNNGPWKSWWWVDRDDFVVAFGDLPHFTKEKGFPYVRWLPPGVDSVYVLRHD